MESRGGDLGCLYFAVVAAESQEVCSPGRDGCIPAGGQR